MGMVFKSIVISDKVKGTVFDFFVNPTELDTLLHRFRTFFPEHQDKTLYGILAAVDISAELREKVLQAGFYVARIQDEVFELDTPESFSPRAY